MKQYFTSVFVCLSFFFLTLSLALPEHSLIRKAYSKNSKERETKKIFLNSKKDVKRNTIQTIRFNKDEASTTNKIRLNDVDNRETTYNSDYQTSAQVSDESFVADRRDTFAQAYQEGFNQGNDHATTQSYL